MLQWQRKCIGLASEKQSCLHRVVRACLFFLPWYMFGSVKPSPRPLSIMRIYHKSWVLPGNYVSTPGTFLLGAPSATRLPPNSASSYYRVRFNTPVTSCIAAPIVTASPWSSLALLPHSPRSSPPPFFHPLSPWIPCKGIRGAGEAWSNV